MAKKQPEIDVNTFSDSDLLDSLLTIHFHIRDADGMHNFEYAKKHWPRYAILYDEVKRRMAESGHTTTIS